MARPRLEDSLNYLTARQVCEQLSISLDLLSRWINRGLFPPPTLIRDNGLRLFSHDWLKDARKIRLRFQEDVSRGRNQS